MKRDEQRIEDCWRIQDLYENDLVWEEDFDKIQKLCKDFAKYEVSMLENGSKLFETLHAKDELQCLLEKAYVYANQKYHEDTGNAIYQGLSGRAQTLAVQVDEALSFVEPKLLTMTEEQLDLYKKQDARLSLYDRYIQEKLRRRSHILSREMEMILSKASEIGQAPGNIFSMFNNADIRFGSIRDEEGQEEELTHGRYVRFLESGDRRVRKEAFAQLYAQYEKFKNTLAATFHANVQQELFFSQMRKYPDSLTAALDGGNIPVKVYDQLIHTVHEHLSSMYEYVNLRKKALGLADLHMYDLYVPLVKNADRRIPFDEAKEIVKKGLSVLGEDYVQLLEKGFQNGWIDVYENEGKRSGAYSWGAYGTHPYVLLNYNHSLNHVFTLAHEMGHALHSYYSDEAQPYLYAGYRIFVAEVASTCNEALLIHQLLQDAGNEQEKAYLINYFLDQFKGTLFRQTMFAEFEQIVHRMVQEQKTLTAQVLCDVYYELNRKYYGEDMIFDREIAMEWARIPHFYTPFYVYQYATGFSAAIAISKKILEGEPGIVEKYKKFLHGGSSQDPIDLLKICGVDMTSPQPVEDALKVFEDYIQELDVLLK